MIEKNNKSKEEFKEKFSKKEVIDIMKLKKAPED